MPDAIAIILARCGSKRVPGKNIRPFLGLPMVAWPTRYACQSGLFREIIISTDSPEIARAATTEGAVCYGMRPVEFSSDYATTGDVLSYELDALRRRGIPLPKQTCCLYGTSAFATPTLMQKGAELLNTTDVDLVMAVKRYEHPIERALLMSADGGMVYRTPEYVTARTQDLAAAFYDVGLMYWFKSAAFMATGEKGFRPLKKRGLVLSAFDAVDIDTEEDFFYAENLASIHTNHLLTKQV
jgi:N-acylneuraminate cytidylyltransferase